MVSVMILFTSTSANSAPLMREKFSRLLTISEARNVCRVIFSSRPAFCGSDCNCFESICVYEEMTASGVLTSCATPAASSPIDDLVGLCQLRFQAHAFGDV